MAWFDKNVNVADGEALAKLFDAPELESVHLAFVPSAKDVENIAERLLPRHPALELRIHSLPKGSDVSVLARLESIRRLKLDFEIQNADFLKSLDELTCLHLNLKRGVKPETISWPKRLLHLSLVADALGGLAGPSELKSFSVAAKVDDYAFLAAFPELSSLSLDGRSFGSLSGLTRCKRLQHVRINGQAKVEVAQLEPCAEIPSLEFVQLCQLPRIEDLRWLGKKPKHLELNVMKGLRSIDWPGLPLVESLGFCAPLGKVAEWDLSSLPKLPHLRRVCIPPLIRKAKGGADVLKAFEGERNPYITDFRKQIAAELRLDSPYV